MFLFPWQRIIIPEHRSWCSTFHWHMNIMWNKLLTDYILPLEVQNRSSTVKCVFISTEISCDYSNMIFSIPAGVLPGVLRQLVPSTFVSISTGTQQTLLLFPQDALHSHPTQPSYKSFIQYAWWWWCMLVFKYEKSETYECRELDLEHLLRVS